MAALFAGVKRFYDTTALSDCTIICNGRRWKAHKLLLCANAESFRAAFVGQFKDAQQTEHELGDEDDGAVAAMMHYLYHANYDVPENKDQETSEHMFHLRVHAMGAKYSVCGLAELAKLRIDDLLDKSFDATALAEMVEAIYDVALPDNSIRKKILQVTRSRRDELFAFDGKHKKFREVAMNTPDFMFDLLCMSGVDFSVGRIIENLRKMTPPGAPVDLHRGLTLVTEMLNTLVKGAPGYVAAQAELEAEIDRLKARIAAAQGSRRALLPRPG